MESLYLLELLNKHQQNKLTKNERQQLDAWFESLNKEEKGINYNEFTDDDSAEKMLTEFRLLQNNKVPVRQIKFSRNWLRVAAVVSGLSLAGFIFYLIPQTKKSIAVVLPQYKKIDIAPPTGNNAILTLANGTKINIGDTTAGVLATQGKVNIIKQGSDQIVYNSSNATEPSYNTLSIPKGGKPIKIILADGSQVWLNVSSSLTYPTVFVGNARNVTLEGEAYFEVAKNAAKPFYVKHADMEVKVLGTHFNVNTYADEENEKVTLLEGSVNVLKGTNSGVLKPGQQAQVNATKITVKDGVNLAEAIAWKNDVFYFEDADIKSIMRQIQKWYNVDIVYKDEIKDSFVAKISRNVKVSELLKILELTNRVHFAIEKNKITVMK